MKNVLMNLNMVLYGTKVNLLLIFPFLYSIINPIHSQQKQVQFFPLSQVQLLESPFKNAQELNKKYVMEFQPDRLLAPFLREAGLTPKAESYGNWENTGLDGHIGGHYLSALSLMAASTGDTEIKKRLQYMLSELKRCQDANGNGYIGGVPGGKILWEEVSSGNIKAGKFDLNKKWVPLYNIHKTYAGLRDAWLYTHNEMAKDMLVKMTDWAIQLVSKLTDEQIQQMLSSEHGGLNETFADVAVITGNEKYLRLARQFSHKLLLDPLLMQQDKLNGMHANTQIPKVIGFKRIADVANDSNWLKASAFFWETVVHNRSVSIGGNSVNEQFHNSNDFSGMINNVEGPETCNTYNMLRLSKMLFETSADKKYMDYAERALYNHILSSQHPETGGLVYFTPMRPQHYRVYSQSQAGMWCCVGSGIENHAKYGEMIYAHTDNMLMVNLFIPSQLNWKEKNLTVVQTNNFPYEAKTSLTIQTKRKSTFTMKVRYPEWVKSGELVLLINGEEQKTEVTESGYLSLKRTWSNNDKVEILLPMHLYAEQLPDHSPWYSFLYGPIVLAAKTGTNDMAGLFANDERKAHIAYGRRIPLKNTPILVGDSDKLTTFISPVEGKPLTFNLSNLYTSNKQVTMELVPFFGLHESRYIIYWQQTTSQKYAALQQEIEKQDKLTMRMDSITIDEIACGEQQPESDHFIQMENSTTGYSEGMHWRDAGGWFSYQLNNNDSAAAYIYLTYFDSKNERQFDLMLDNELLGSFSLGGGNNKNVKTANLEIPAKLKTNKLLTIRFVAKNNKNTAQVIGIRLLNSSP